jgi:hypothetical protein
MHISYNINHDETILFTFFYIQLASRTIALIHLLDSLRFLPSVVTLFEGQALKEGNIFSLTLIQIQPCHFLSKVTISCSESVFVLKILAELSSGC